MVGRCIPFFGDMLVFRGVVPENFGAFCCKLGRYLEPKEGATWPEGGGWRCPEVEARGPGPSTISGWRPGWSTWSCGWCGYDHRLWLDLLWEVPWMDGCWDFFFKDHQKKEVILVSSWIFLMFQPLFGGEMIQFEAYMFWKKYGLKKPPEKGGKRWFGRSKPGICWLSWT